MVLKASEMQNHKKKNNMYQFKFYKTEVIVYVAFGNRTDSRLKLILNANYERVDR